MASKNHYISQFLISGNDIVNASVTFADLGTVYTDNVTEGTSLYFSNARVANAFVGTGTANALLYLNSSKVATTNSNMTFDGNNLILGGSSGRRLWFVANGTSDTHYVKYDSTIIDGLAINGYSGLSFSTGSTTNGTWAEQMRLTSTGLTTQKDATIYGLTVGRGAGAVGTNTVVGSGALAANTTGIANDAFGYESLKSNTTANENVGFGYQTLWAATTGGTNTALGSAAVRNTTTGASNTGVGYRALYNNTTASYNTAVGYQAGYTNTTGTRLTAVGYLAGYTSNANYCVYVGAYAGQLQTGANNTAVGDAAFYASGTGTDNAAFGTNALQINTSGSYNTAIGRLALALNTTASYNTAVGYQAGYNNTTGGENVAIGQGALQANTTGYRQVAIGNTSLASVTTNGNSSVAVGWRAGANVTTGGVTAIGYYTCQSVTTGVSNVGVGSNTNGSTTGSYNVTVGDLCFGSGAGNYNTAIGHQVLYAMGNTASGNTGVGFQALYYNGNTASISGNTAVGQSALSNLTGNFNTAIGYNSGSSITSGSKNTILGGYNGNQGGLDIRTASNYIVLSDGDGTPRFYVNNYGAASIGFTGSAGVGLNQATGTMLMVSDYNNGGFGCLSLGAPSGNYGSIGYGFAPTSTGFKYTNNDYSSRILFAASITTFTSVVGTAGTAITYTQGPYVANGGTSWTSSSDVRLKNVTGGITGALAKVQAMNPVWFSWKRDAANAQNLGFIAQELHQVLPEVVDVPTHETDPRSGEQNYWGVNYTEIVPLLTAAIQELKSELDLVKAELATLKGN